MEQKAEEIDIPWRGVGNKPDCNQTGEHVSGNIFLRPVRLDKKGDVLPGHTHYFDHTTFVTQGRVHVFASCEGGCAKPWEGVFGPGEFFLVKANWLHEITALEDETRFTCIYSHRNAQGEVVQTMQDQRAYH